MNLLLTFMELDKLNESTMSRQDLISHIKASGRNYNFENKSTEQLFRIWERIQKDIEKDAAMKEYHDMLNDAKVKTCPECGMRLSDGSLCPVCDDNEEDFLYEWLDASGNKVKNQASTSTTSTRQTASVPVTPTNIVTIVYDNSKHKLRAQADDGVHGIGNVAFPNSLRTEAGQQYEVETLIWNGKNYRVSGNITPI